jgi:hypothetical protein
MNDTTTGTCEICGHSTPKGTRCISTGSFNGCANCPCTGVVDTTAKIDDTRAERMAKVEARTAADIARLELVPDRQPTELARRAAPLQITARDDGTLRAVDLEAVALNASADRWFDGDRFMEAVYGSRLWHYPLGSVKDDQTAKVVDHLTIRWSRLSGAQLVELCDDMCQLVAGHDGDHLL